MRDLSDRSKGRVLIAGCGLVGTELGTRLVEAGYEVFGLRRRTERLPPEIHGIRADLEILETVLDGLPSSLDFVFHLASSSGRDSGAYRAAHVAGPQNLIRALTRRGERPKRLISSSSTGVYSHTEGEWVDESTSTQPAEGRAALLLEGEQVFQTAPFPSVISRFSGIYSAARIRLLRQVARGEAALDDSFTNRIHVADCAGVLHFLLQLPDPAPVYIASDEEPVKRSQLVNWLREQIGAQAPEIPASNQPSRQSRRGNKRCSSRLLRDSGYRFIYSTFREGYTQILDAIDPDDLLR